MTEFLGLITIGAIISIPLLVTIVLNNLSNLEKDVANIDDQNKVKISFSLINIKIFVIYAIYKTNPTLIFLLILYFLLNIIVLKRVKRINFEKYLEILLDTYALVAVIIALCLILK